MTIQNTDWYLRQGIEHAITEDYVVTNDRHVVIDNDGRIKKNIPGPIKGPAYAILCDGCSSSPYTDIGARGIAHHAKMYKKKNGNFGESSERWKFYIEMYEKFHNVAIGLGMPTQSSDATLLTAEIHNGQYQLSALGDGIFAGRTRTGDVVFTEINFPSNAPMYLRLIFDREAYKRYCEEFGRQIIIRHSKLTASGDKYEIVTELVEELTLPEKVVDGPYWFNSQPFLYTVESMEAVAILSDGASSFRQYDKTPTGTRITPVPVEAILWEIMSFKRYGGHFVQARCNKAFAKFEKLNWRNVDDFSIAVIHCDYKKG